jgi:hypothetical protein
VPCPHTQTDDFCNERCGGNYQLNNGLCCCTTEYPNSRVLGPSDGSCSCKCDDSCGSSPTPSSKGGGSSGVGLGVGLGLTALAGGCFFMYRRQQAQRHHQFNNHNSYQAFTDAGAKARI